MTAFHPDFVRLPTGDLVLPDQMEAQNDPLVRFYEPAALWEVFTHTPVSSADELAVLAGTREFWRNGGEHELVLTQVLVDGIGYLLDESTTPPDGVGDESGQYYAGRLAALEQARIRIRRRGVKPITNWLDVTSLASLPRAEADPRSNPASATARDCGALFGRSRWEFDRPYKLPPNTVVDFALSPVTAFDHVDSPPNPYAVIALEEWVAAGGRMRTNQRIHKGQLPFVETPQVTPYPGSNTPTVTPLGILTSLNTVINSDQAFPFRMSPASFRRQASNQGAGHTWLNGLNVLLWQARYDDILSGDVSNALYAEPFAPLASRIITKAGALTGGTQRQWWRDGAPLSLVTPTQTPANVFELPVPIRLSPGETLEVEIELQGDHRTYGDGEVTGTGTTLTNVGVSLTGYSEVRL